MAQTVKHVKVSGVPDGSDTAQVQPSDWNADHAITGTVAYSEISGTPNLALKADLASPTFTGNPLAPTPAAADSDTSIATTAHVHAAIAADVVRASTTEVLTGTDAAKVVTPDALAALWELGASVAAASNTVLGEGGIFGITAGAATINDITFATPKDGRGAWVVFGTSGITLTHSASLDLPGGANITTVSLDRMYVAQVSSSVRRVLVYQRADGTIIPTATASTTDVLTGTNATKAVTPDALAALWEYTTVAVGTTITLTEGGFFNITGAAGVSISSIVFQTPKAGRSAWLWFVNAHTIVHGANLDCPGAQNLPVKDHDRVLITCTGASSYVVTAIERADGNIYFPATQQASSGANVLDDYEEGTWTPTFTAATTPPTSVTYTTQSGAYTKVGRAVHYDYRMDLSSKGTGGVGQCQTAGFPFASAGNIIEYMGRHIGVTLPSSGASMWGLMSGSTLSWGTETNTASGDVQWSDVAAGNSGHFSAGTYKTT